MGVTLNDNNAKLDNLERAIKAANERRRKLIEKNKMITYDTLSNLYGKEGQELIDTITAEHTLIGKLTDSGMTYEQIGELADDNNVSHQMSFTDKKNPYED